MNHAIEILTSERLKLREWLRLMARQAHEVMCSIPTEDQERQLAEIDAALAVLQVTP